MRTPASVAQLVGKGMTEAIEVGECLEWQGRIGNGASIPVVKSREGKTYSAEYSVPRFLWEQEKGPIPEGKILYRKCCNNACVKLKHFAVGTRADWQENRKKHGLTKHAANHIANLTQGARRRSTSINTIEKAREVRTLLASHTQREVAEMTGVSLAMVCDIGRGRAWKDHANPFAGLFTGLASNDSNRSAA